MDRESHRQYLARRVHDELVTATFSPSQAVRDVHLALAACYRMRLDEAAAADVGSLQSEQPIGDSRHHASSQQTA